MRATGIVRKIDELGRIVLPIELRRTLDIMEHDAFEIFVDGESVVLRKYEPACTFCGSDVNVVDYRGKKVCQSCIREMKKL